MKIRGHGGYWVKLLPPQFDDDQSQILTGFIVHNAEYEVMLVAVVRETRSVGCGGWSEGLPKYRRVEYASFKVAEDDVFYPEALGFTEGAEVTVFLKRGELNQFALLEGAIVESVRPMNDQKKARWVEIVCKHGRYLREAEPPEITDPPSAGSPPGEEQGDEDEGEE